MVAVAACVWASLAGDSGLCAWGKGLSADAFKGTAWVGSAAGGAGKSVVSDGVTCAVVGSASGRGSKTGSALGSGGAWRSGGTEGDASVAIRVWGAAFGGRVGAGTAAAVGGIHRVCMGPLRTSVSVGKRKSSVPDTLSSARTCATSTLSTKATKVRREGGPDKTALSCAAGDGRLEGINPASPNRPTVVGRIGAVAGQSAHPIRCRGWPKSPATPRPKPNGRRHQKPGHTNRKCRATTH